jgi:hypothetical protein
MNRCKYNVQNVLETSGVFQDVPVSDEEEGKDGKGMETKNLTAAISG